MRALSRVEGMRGRGRAPSFTPGFVLVELSLVTWLLFLPYLLSAHGHLDFARHAVGRDFVNLWTAGQLVFTPHVTDIFNPTLFLGWEHRLFDPRLPFHFWSYPPPALFLAAPLAGLPYIPALAVWSLVGLLALVPAARLTFSRRAQRLLLLFAPAVAVNIALGQNGALTGALLLSGLALFEPRPLLAGALLGLLVFKPQLAVLLPVAVLASRNWRAAAAAAATASGVLLLSLVVFGPACWKGFFGPTLEMQSAMLSHGQGPFQWMMPSVFMAARVEGAPASLAMAAQVPFMLLGAAMVYGAFRRPGPVQDRTAILILATFIATPQAFNYDLVAAAAVALALIDRDRSFAGLLAGALLFALPTLLLAAQVVNVPFGPPILLYAGWRFYQSRPKGAEGKGEAAAEARRADSASMAAETASNT